jgi:hypothetical protein
LGDKKDIAICFPQGGINAIYRRTTSHVFCLWVALVSDVMKRVICEWSVDLRGNGIEKTESRLCNCLCHSSLYIGNGEYRGQKESRYAFWQL